MNNLFKFSLLFFFFFYYCIGAQQVVKKDTISGVPFVIAMDSKINDLMEEQEENCVRKNTVVNDETTINKPKVVVEKPLTDAEICRKNPRIMGYKIQVAVVKSNDDAKEIGLQFRRMFPNMKVEIDASLRPNYKVMAGSYFTKQSAAPDLTKIKQYFKDAISVQYRVFCVEAK